MRNGTDVNVQKAAQVSRRRTAEIEQTQKRLFVFTETKSHCFDVLAIVLVKAKLAFLDVRLQRTPEEMEGFVMLLAAFAVPRRCHRTYSLWVFIERKTVAGNALPSKS
jgi:hypothetical protein